MKRTFAILTAILLVVGQVSFAQPVSEKDMAFSGKVDSITVPDPDRGLTEGSMILIDGSGNAKNFVLNAATKFLDKDGKSIEGDDVDLGAKVTAKYSKSDEGNIVDSVTLMP